MAYQLVAGLETHIELSTQTKIFCGCTTRFGAQPNTNCCPICIGLPGTLPTLNRQVVRYAIMAGLATNCTISKISKMDRKNYCYPDLSKAYQISQYDIPLCTGGFIALDSGKKIRINRIHIEEDAGKLVHSGATTLVDYNRGGVPLIEIVTEPDFRSIDEAKEYLEKLQLMMRAIGVSDCKMQQGSLRCDVNISVRKGEDAPFGTRAEVKNMNSFSFMVKAMQSEFERQCDLLDSGEEVVQETRRYDEATGTTQSMRGKEDADDYRYFRDPDLVSIEVSDEEIDEIKKSLPMLPDERRTMYKEKFGLSDIDAAQLTKYRKVSEFFEEVVARCKTPKFATNFMVGAVYARMSTEEQKEQMQIDITPTMLADLIGLLEQGKINQNLAKQTLEKMLDTGKPYSCFIEQSDMGQLDDGQLKAACEAAVQAMPNAVADYKNGKDKAIKAMVGFVMKHTKGKADPAKAQDVLVNLIN